MSKILYWLFFYSDVYNAFKPLLVWLFIQFKGDQKMIGEFLRQKIKVDRKTIEEDLKDVRLKDYVSIVDFGKEKYFNASCITSEIYVTTKEDFREMKVICDIAEGRYKKRF